MHCEIHFPIWQKYTTKFSRRVYDITELKWVQLTFSGSQVFWEGENLRRVGLLSFLLVLLVFNISHHEIYRHRVFTGSDGKEYEWELRPSECNVISDLSLIIVVHGCLLNYFFFEIAVSQGCFKAPSRILPPSKFWYHRRRSTIFFRNFSRRTTYG